VKRKKGRDRGKETRNKEQRRERKKRKKRKAWI